MVFKNLRIIFIAFYSSLARCTVMIIKLFACKMERKSTSCLLQDFPVVIKNKIAGWKILSYGEEDWCNLFNNKLLKFRQGRKIYTETPYWEHLCESKEMTLKRFFDLSSKKSDHWLYFDYKYVKDVFPQSETFTDGFRWADLASFDLREEESVLWIGNEGAHTPCHKDTYGCNLVAQLFGRKLWILMPPEETENLKAVRVPYEESSVYSVFNFYAPNNKLLNVKHAFRVILSPGDVLYVPRHWWHYVENLEPAISINTWIPLNEDHESRLDESLVQYYISSICQNLTVEESKQILNPTEYSLISKPCTLNVIEKCIENYKKHCKLDKGNKMKHELWDETVEVEELCIESFIEEKNKINSLNLSTSKRALSMLNQKVSIAETLINCYCRQSNINSIKKVLLEE